MIDFNQLCEKWRRSKGKHFFDSDKKLVVFVKLYDQEKRDDIIQQNKLFEKMELDHENMLTNCWHLSFNKIEMLFIFK